MHGMCHQRRHNLIVIAVVAEEVGGRCHLLLLLLGLLLGSLGGRSRTTSSSAAAAAAAAAHADGLDLLEASLEDIGDLLADELLELLGLGVVDGGTNGLDDLLDVSDGRLVVATDNRQHVSRNDLHVFKIYSKLS